MHPSVPDECKPILLSGTQRIPFPSPLKKIKMPKKLKESDAHLDQKLMQKEGPTMVRCFWDMLDPTGTGDVGDDKMMTRRLFSRKT